MLNSVGFAVTRERAYRVFEAARADKIEAFLEKNQREGEKMNHFEEQTVFDCIVCGSGPAGLGASMAAAKLGARVLVLESAGQPGGTICAVPFMPVNRLRTEKKPRSDVHEAFVRHLTALGSAACYPGPEDRINGDGICPHPEYAELAIYNMLEEAGVTLKLFSPVVDVETAENSLCAVITREKRGLVRYRARVFVDATGDGDVAAAAGCPFMEGKDSESADEGVRMEIVPQAATDVQSEAPVHMPITLGFSLAGLDCARFFRWFRENGAAFKAMLEQADQKGLYIAAWYAFNHGTAPGVMGVNNGAWLHQKLTSNGLDAADLTTARRAGLRVAADLVTILRENQVPGAENCTLERVGAVMGVRDTRRIEGTYVLTFADSQESREFPDTIARKYGAIDANQLFIGTMDSGFAYPYRSLVPKGMDALLLAGRCASATFLGHSAGKSMGNMMALGCAAGAAAALCAANGVQPRELDATLLRETLRDRLGASL